jgi:hypothetical protein
MGGIWLSELVPNWDEQRAIDGMIWMLEELGLSARKVAEMMNQSGSAGKQGGKWTSSSVLRTVRNTFHSNRDSFVHPDFWGTDSWERPEFQPYSG